MRWDATSGAKRLKSWLPLFAAVLLSTCSQSGSNMYHGSNQQRAVPDGMAVTITNVGNEADARPLAEAYCAKYDRSAHFNRIELFHAYRTPIASNSASFNCVSRSP
jgi:hypothetical protein